MKINLKQCLIAALLVMGAHTANAQQATDTINLTLDDMSSPKDCPHQ